MGRTPSTKTRRFLASNELGASAVELAIIAPLLFLLLFGIVDFGLIMNNYISLRQGSRDGARAGVVAEFGSNAGCTLIGATEANEATTRLMCLTKDRIGLDASTTRIKVAFGSGGYAAKAPLVVCAQVPLKSTTGYLSSVIPERELQTKVQMRTEKISTTGGLAGADEDALPGGSWSWCTVS